MIVEVIGKIVDEKAQAIVLNVNGLCYEVHVSKSVLARLSEVTDEQGNVHLIVYHYLQIGPASGIPILIGFINEIERDFFQQFIKVSGIGPRAAVRALDKPISQITEAIDAGDIKFLKTLPGIGLQRAKEIIAKLQGKVGKFGLIQDQESGSLVEQRPTPDWQEEAMDVLLQLQYKRPEALGMIEKALERSESVQTTEDLLNEIYKQKVKA